MNTFLAMDDIPENNRAMENLQEVRNAREPNRPNRHSKIHGKSRSTNRDCASTVRNILYDMHD